MIDILVLDDDTNKTNNIIEELQKIPEIERDRIEIASDIISAKRLLLQRQFDLLLVDIKVPNRFGESPKRDGGLSLVKEIAEGSRYHLPMCIIGITAYDDIIHDFAEVFSIQLWSMVKYDETSDQWISQIQSKVKYLIDYKRGARLPVRSEYDYDLAIITALENPELESLKHASSEWSRYEIAYDSTNYYSCLFSNDKKSIRVISAAASQMGLAPAAVTTMKLIYNFCPRYLVMIGIAAGIRGKVNIGDIIIADPSWDHGSGKFYVQDDSVVFQAAPLQERLNPDLKAAFEFVASQSAILEDIRNGWQGNKPDCYLQLHIGPLASGAAVLATSEILDVIRASNKDLIGIDMETYGVLFAASNCPKPRPTAFSIKSVCDFADAEKNDDYQKYAAYTSAQFIKRFALECLDLSTSQ